MSKNSIDELIKAYKRYPFGIETEPHINGVQFKAELAQLLLEEAELYNAKSTNGVMNPPDTGVLAVPVDKIKAIFGVGEDGTK